MSKNFIQFLVSTYYANLTSILIVYDSGSVANSPLRQYYVDNVQLGFENQPKLGNINGLQWINVKYLNESGEDFKEQILKAVDIVSVEGFITILANTSRFLHARYYATRYSTLRLKDKLYLFLCESEENPKDFLATEILQFYPHHLMVIPETIHPETNNNDYTKKLQAKDIGTHRNTTQNQNRKQAGILAKRTITNNKLKVTNVTSTMEMAVDKTTTRIASFSSSFHTNILHDTNNYKYRDINFELWTQQYVGAEGNLNAIHLDTYMGGNGKLAKNVELYPNKLSNLQQRSMRIGSLTYVPYVKTGYVPPGEGDVDSINSTNSLKNVQFTGGEAELTKTFCELLNCHLRVEPYADDSWGVIYENGSSEGLLGDVYNQHIEMAIGCIYNWYNDVTETSQNIARSAVTILVPGPSQFPRWRTIIMPFSIGLWLFLALTIVVCAVTFNLVNFASHRFEITYAVRQSNDNNKTSKTFERALLDIFAIFIQQPSADTVLRHMATRIFVMFLLTATITLENTYSGQLKSLLTMPLFNDPIDTTEKWSLTKWEWAAPSIIWIHTVEKSDIPKEQRLAKQFKPRNHEFLSKAIFRDDYGIGIERVPSGLITFGEYVTKAALAKKIVLKDDLYFDWTRAVAIRGWPLMPLFDRHLLYFLETGIYIFWDKKISYKYLDNQVQDILGKLSTGYKPNSPPQILSMEHISGPLFILLFGYLLAFLIFMIELFGHNLKEELLKRVFYLTKLLYLKKK